MRLILATASWCVPCQTVKAFAKENAALVIKGGIMDGKVLSASDVQKIADLESREVLLSKLAGAMKAKQNTMLHSGLQDGSVGAPGVAHKLVLITQSGNVS